MIFIHPALRVFADFAEFFVVSLPATGKNTLEITLYDTGIVVGDFTGSI